MPNHDTSFCSTWSKVNNYYTQDIFKKKSEKVGLEHSSPLKKKPFELRIFVKKISVKN